MDYNRVIIAGNLTKDPEKRATAGGETVAGFSLAVHRKEKGEDKTDFFDCAAFGKTAETLLQWCQKGRGILVEGRLRQEKWEDRQSGEKRSRVGVVVDRFVFADGKRDEQAPAPAPTTGQGPREEEIPF